MGLYRVKKQGDRAIPGQPNESPLTQPNSQSNSSRQPPLALTPNMSPGNQPNARRPTSANGAPPAMSNPPISKRNFDPDVGEHGVDRDKLNPKAFAGAHRSFPIVSPKDVHDAAVSLGRTNQDRAKVKAHIISIAHRKGSAFTARLPSTWKKRGEKEAANKMVLLDSLESIRKAFSDTY